jgi:uncharacterized protein (UPF0548 family)
VAPTSNSKATENRFLRDLPLETRMYAGELCGRAKPNVPGLGNDHAVSVYPMSDGRAAELRSAALTYPEHGMTRQDLLPAGYRTFSRSRQLRSGLVFSSLRADMLSWMVQSRSGLRVIASSDVTPDAVVELRIGIGALSTTAPCRVVYVIDEPDRCGFGYGTLPGHPESGEESFLLERTTHGALTFTVRAFSRPAALLTRVAGPIGHRVQDLITTRYLRALG